MPPTTDTDDEDRLETSIPDDVAAFVPDDAKAVIELPAEPTPKMFLTDSHSYNTGVRCTRCFCDVAVTDRETGAVSCPNCNWSSATE